MDEGYQLNVVTLPKSVKPERMRDNVEIFDSNKCISSK